MLLVTLPSGRAIALWHLELIGPGEWSYQVQGRTQYGYGSKLWAIICQAGTRDLLADLLVRAQRRQIPVVLHVHDEVGTLAVEAQAPSVERQLRELLEERVDWAPDLALAAKVETMRSYKK